MSGQPDAPCSAIGHGPLEGIISWAESWALIVLVMMIFSTGAVVGAGFVFVCASTTYQSGRGSIGSEPVISLVQIACMITASAFGTFGVFNLALSWLAKPVTMYGGGMVDGRPVMYEHVYRGRSGLTLIGTLAMTMMVAVGTLAVIGTLMVHEP